MTTTWGPIVYPAAIDGFAPALIDNVDEVIANHPNSLSTAIRAIETKLGITNAPVTGLGGVSFDPAGKAANPGAAGSPTVWVDNSGGPGFILYYTDDLGATYDLRAGGITIQNWTPATGYTVDQEVMYVGLRFRCIGAHTSGGTFFNDTDLSKWTCVSENGFIINQVAHGFSELDVVYSNAGVWTLADSSAAATLSIPPALVVGVGTALNYFLIATESIVTLSLHGLTVDDIYYLSDSVAGQLTATEPTAQGSYSSPIVRPMSANTLAILPFSPILVDYTTLDEAYDAGGSGVGRAITADSGATTITVPDTSNNAGLEITQNDSTNNPVAVSITNAGSGVSLNLAGAGSRVINSDNANLDITTTTAGDLNLTSIAVVDIDGTDIEIDGSGGISLDAATASNFTVSGAAADLTFGARAATVTLNELGDTALSGSFTATSIIGALNELLSSVTAVTLDQAYDGGGSGVGRVITADSGSVAITVPNTSNNVGLEVTQSDSTNNPNAVVISNAGSGSAISLAGAGSRKISSDTGNMTIETTTSGHFYINTADTYNVSAGSDVTIATTTSLYLQCNSGFGGDYLSLYSAQQGEFAANGNLNLFGGTGVTITPYNDLTGTFLNVYDGGGTAGMNSAAGTDTWANFEGRFEQSGTAGYTVLNIDTNEVSNGSGTRKLLNVAYEGTPQVWITYDGVMHVTDKITGDAADLTLEGRSASITLNEVGETALSNYVATSIIGALNEIKEAPIDLQMHGFVDNTETSIGFNDGTYTFTLTDAGGGWSYYRDGIKYTISGNKTTTLAGSPPATDDYYIYIDATDGTLSNSTTPWTLTDSKVPVAIVRWNDTLTPKYVLLEERHTSALNKEMHRYEHLTYGARLESSGALSSYVVSSDVDANKQFDIAQTKIWDEDLQSTLAALTGGVDNYHIGYRTGAATWVWEESSMPFDYTPAGYINYDNAGSMTQGQNNKFYTTYLIATNNQGTARFVTIHGQSEFSSQADAVAEQFTELTLTGLPITEGVAIWKFVWETSSGYSSTGKCRLAIAPIPVNSNVTTAAAFPGLGTMSVQDADNVAIVGGDIAGLTSFDIGGTTTVNGIIDDDAMGTASDTTLATSESIKAYVDATAAAAAGAVSLDGAYNTGNTIDVDGDPVTLTVSDTDNNSALSLVQNDVTNNPTVLDITNTGTGNDISLVSGGTIGSTADGDITFDAGLGYIKNSSDYFTDRIISQAHNTFFGVGSTPAGLAHTAGTEGWYNSNFGYGAGSGITTGYLNVCFGRNSGNGITTGYGNLTFGANNGNALATGAYNVIIGASAGVEQATDYSAYIGVLAGQYLNGSSNVAMGYSALRGVTGTSTGAYNVGIGRSAGLGITTGNHNTFLGRDAGNSVTEGTGNICVGYQAGDNLTTADYAVIIGASVDADSISNNYQLNICNVIKCSNWNLNGDLVLIPNGTGITQIGDAGSTSHSLTANDDLFVSGKLEVDGTIYFDGSANFYSSFTVADNVRFILGNSGDTSLDYSTAQATSNTLVWGFSNEGNSLILTNTDNRDKDHDHAAQTNPTLFIHSDTDPDSDNTQWMSLTHDQTNGVIQTGKGNLTIGSGSTSQSLTTPNDLFVSGKLEVDGVGYFDTNTNFYGNMLLADNVALRVGSSADTLLDYSTAQATSNTLVWGFSNEGNSLILTNVDSANKDHDHAAQTNPTLFIHSVTDPDSDNTQWGSLAHNQTDFVTGIGSGSKVTEHEDPVELADDGYFDLPTASAGFGTFLVDDGEEFAEIYWKTDGTVQLVNSSTNVQTSDLDGNFCAFDNGTAVRIRNRLGAAKSVMFDYHYTTSP